MCFEMKTLCVIQHVEAEYLGLMEDHFEGRNIRFNYCRPFSPGGKVPATAEGFDGLVVLGAGPLGIVSGNLIPSLGPELRLAGDFLAHSLPIVGIGIGACILSTAAGGGAEEAPLRFTIETVECMTPHALGGHLPQRFPATIYMRDRPALPTTAEVLAATAAGEPLMFQYGQNCLGFLGHPGIKSAMIEDMVMEFEEAPTGTIEGLAALREVQGEITAALGKIMIGLIEVTGLM